MGRSQSRPVSNIQVREPYSTSALLASGSIKTGDVLLFHGATLWSRIIELFTWSRYSHMGVVVSGADLNAVLARRAGKDASPDANPPPPPPRLQLPPDALFLFESVGHLDGIACVLHAREKTGVRVVPLARKLAAYQAEDPSGAAHICLISLEVSLPDLYSVLSARLGQFVCRVCGLDYDAGVAHTMQELWPGVALPTLQAQHRLAHPGAREYNCSELAATALVEMGVLVAEFATNVVLPSSFDSGDALPASAFVTPAAVLSQKHFHIRVAADGPAAPAAV